MRSDIFHSIVQLEAERKSFVLVYCSGRRRGKQISAEDAETIYCALEGKFDQRPIDLVLNTEGGQVAAAYKIARLLREFGKEYRVLIPQKARSAGTLLALGASHIVMNPLSELSPIDANFAPSSSNSSEMTPPRISTEDIRAFRKMAKEWFSIKDSQQGLALFSLLSQRIFPATLGAFYSADQYLKKIGVELLAQQRPRWSGKRRNKIIERLISEWPIHTHSIDRQQAKDLGIAVMDANPRERVLMQNILDAAHARLGHSNATQGSAEVEKSCLICTKEFESHFHIERRQVPGMQTSAERGSSVIFQEIGEWRSVSLK
jgi:hypothetical protein